jgi:outer membrane receptor protein involved in Fe transport
VPTASNLVPIATALSLVSPIALAADGDSTPAAPASSVQSVVVTARKLNVETLIDRKVYTVEADLQSAFGTVSDVLTAIPSVDVDVDGGVTLRGDGNVLILIDGKPSPLFSGPSAGDNLQSIPSKDIERIEVITVPPAQFKAEGTAGVINIILRHPRVDGTAGTVQGSLGSGGRSLVGGSLSYGKGPLSLGLTGTYRQDFKRRVSRNDMISVDPATGAQVDHVTTFNEFVRRANPPLELTARYVLDERRLLTASVSRTGRAGLRTYTEGNLTEAESGTLLESHGRTSAGHDRERIVDTRVGYTERLARPGESLEISLHHSAATETEHYDYANFSILPAAPEWFNNFGFHDEHGGSEASIDWIRPASKALTLKLGASVEQNDFLYRAASFNVDPTSGIAIEDLSARNDFRYWQQVGAGYATLQGSAGAWSWLGGARLEYTRDEGRQLVQSLATLRHDLRLYPSLHVERSVSPTSTISLGASRRVTRPDPESLNPYVDREYTPTLLSGNPLLRPQLTWSYEIGYGYDGGARSASLTGYYRQNQDMATDILEDLGNGFTLRTRANLPRNDSAGIEFSTSGELVPRLHYMLSGNAFYAEIDGAALGTPGLRTTTGVNAKLKLDWHVAGGAAQLSFNRNDHRLTAQGQVGAVNVVNLGFRRPVGAQLTAVATLSDALNGQHFEIWSSTPTFQSHFIRWVHGQVLFVGLIHAFGSAGKEKASGFEYDP